MPEVHQFGALVPVCTGKLRVGGRMLAYGEHVPGAEKWPHHIRKMHVDAGNLSFVNRAQAEEMIAVAEEANKAQAVKTVSAGIEAAKARVAALADERKALKEKDKELAEREKEAVKILADAEKALKAAQAGKLPEAKKDAGIVEDKKDDGQGAGLEEAKRQAKERLNSILADLTPADKLGVDQDLSKLSYKELQATAKEHGVAHVGRTRADIENDTGFAIKRKALADRQQEEGLRAAQKVAQAAADILAGTAV